MSITVTKPFTKRSALRELGIYFHSGRLSREDYVARREQLIDHLCGLNAQLDPVLTMLLRSAAGGAKGKSDVTAPQDNTAPVPLNTAAGADNGADVQDRLLKILLVAIVVVAVAIAGGWWWTRKASSSKMVVAPPATSTPAVAPAVVHTNVLEQQLLDFCTQELSQASVDTLLQGWAAASPEQRAQVVDAPAYRTFRRMLQEQLQALQAYSPAELANNVPLNLVQQLAATMQLPELQKMVQDLRPASSAPAPAAPPVTPAPQSAPVTR